MCDICQNWERITHFYKFKTAEGIPLITNHHPDCPHYNDSLMDVWKVTLDGGSCYVGNEQDARDTAGDEEPLPTVTQEKMHREIFENLPEFGGF